MLSPDDRGRDGVVDQEHADEHRDEAHHGEIELEAAEDLVHFLSAAGRSGDARVFRQELAKTSDRRGAVARLRQLQLNGTQFTATAEKFLGPADIHCSKVRIEAVVFSNQKTDLELLFASSCPHPDLVTRLEAMLPDEFLRDRDRVRSTEPALNIEVAGFEIRRIEGAERFVGENVDAEDLEVIPAKIRKRHEPFD